MATATYTWKRGDIFTNGRSRWEVDKVSADGERAMLRSVSSPWATTRALTFDEWNDDGQWALEKWAAK